MLFNSIDFAIFLPIVFTLYWFVSNGNLRTRNFILLIASYVFYGWWDYRFLALILISTFVDYTIAKKIAQYDDKKSRKHYLTLSMVANLGLLGFFKYYNFFIDNFANAFTFLGNDINPNRLDIVLPVGISFYTFQTMSYTIDVYRKEIQPTKDFFAFSSFVSFFPQLVAGPIERAKNLLPQFHRVHKFDYATSVDGLRQILWGLVKKVVIADNCAVHANEIFNHSSQYSGSTLLLGSVFFAFQIYGDFSGYSDIAIGTGRLFGFNLRRNFAYPYFSRDIAEFWRKWHISLSTWFRDYLYIPLGGSRGNRFQKVRNVFIIFIVSGFWHGANWTFIFWGMLNAFFFLPLLLTQKNRTHLDVSSQGRMMPTLYEAYKIVRTFFLVCLAWIFFRSENISNASEIYTKVFSGSIFSIPSFDHSKEGLIVMVGVLIFTLLEWVGRHWQYGIEKLGLNWGRPARWAFYFGLIILVLKFSGSKQEFIYFQF